MPWASTPAIPTAQPDVDHRDGLAGQAPKYSYDIVDAIEVIGGTNIQFARSKTGRVVVIEITPNLAFVGLASKATGFPDRHGFLMLRRRPHA